MTRWRVPGWHTGDVTKWRSVADDLAARIRGGEYAPGSMLPSVRDLMEMYSVAMNTITTALRHLAAEGLVEAEPQRGHRVTGVDGGSLASRVKALESSNAEIRRHLGLPNPD
jgi:DNA-binding GntR family transcriptional regulator